MPAIGRNELCTCGSGKKYKKCCGKKDVVSMELLIENELDDIQDDILHFSIQNYEKVMDEYLEQSYEEFDIPDEAMDVFHFFAYTWLITSVELDGNTIMAEYLDKHTHKIKRQRTKDIVRSWRHARPSVSIVLNQEESQYIIVQDIFTKEEQRIKLLEENEAVEIGGILLGTILPTGTTSIFFTIFVDIPASEAEGLKDAVLHLFDDSGEESHVDFMETAFLEVLDLFMFGSGEVAIDDLEWMSPKHKEVAINYKEYMEDCGHEETIITLGVVLWNQYCLQTNRLIKKTSVYEASLIYLVEQLLPFPFGGLITQMDLAEEFEVSSSSISSKYNELKTVLSEEIEELHINQHLHSEYF